MLEILIQGNKGNIEVNESKMDVYASSQPMYSLWVIQYVPSCNHYICTDSAHIFVSKSGLQLVLQTLFPSPAVAGHMAYRYPHPNIIKHQSSNVFKHHVLLQTRPSSCISGLRI